MSRAICSMFKGCSGKKVYLHREDAEHGTDLRVYHCPFCGGWHRTTPTWMRHRALRKQKRRIQRRIWTYA